MKKLTLIFATAALFFSASSFANGADEIPARVKTALAKDFINATNITWEKGDHIYFANFSWNSSDVKAAFSADGELLSTSRKLTAAQLPLKITMAVENKYKGYTIQDDAVEIISNDETSYQLNISNGTQVINLTSDAIGTITETAK